MKKYSIVEYDGGYGVNLSDFGDENTFDINRIKWFETRQEAEQYAQFSQFAESGTAFVENAPEFCTIHYLDDSDAPEIECYGADDYVAYLPLLNLAFYVKLEEGATEVDEMDENSKDDIKIISWLESMKKNINK